MSSGTDSKFDFVARSGDVVEERRDFAIGQTLYCQLEDRGRGSRRCNRIAAHRLIAIGGGQAHVNVLAGGMEERLP